MNTRIKLQKFYPVLNFTISAVQTEFSIIASYYLCRNICVIELLKLELRKFYLSKWTSFWEEFRKAVHENDCLISTIKFNYLQSRGWILIDVVQLACSAPVAKGYHKNEDNKVEYEKVLYHNHFVLATSSLLSTSSEIRSFEEK